MKTVYIVRHAKSSWEYKGIEDIDRPLKKRGIKDSYLVASALVKKIDKPDVFITSSASRALSSAVIFSNVFSYPLSNLQIKKSLYNFSDGYLVKTIKALDDEFDSAIIFSHDHGINDFVNKFGDTFIPHVPTCGVVAIRFENNHWKSIKKGKTLFQDFPKNHK
ncbi:histidine phosphatase family protein [Flavicella sp.]|uniref:SixA phosphatase family protein n=1 Tax=Flavicella sp. TaxID=2957742 RepID=UPI0026123667|nr:histidine phosphatase family protein [Flavicella sp.]MDG1803925.1 histidine phosphatase family protein [Flavicella sp.]MDG2279626.1 histidine phosphatase family protein [Flavicella sp.]